MAAATGVERKTSGSVDRAAWRTILADVAVVTVTPFTGRAQARVDNDGLTRNLEHLLRAGVRLLVAGGNTGEFAALSDDEVPQVVRSHVRAALGRARVIAGVGYELRRTVALGRAAIEEGADGLMVHQPIHPYAGEAGLLDYYQALAGALPDVPLTLYVRGPQLTLDGARRLAGLPSVVGVKMGVPDPERFGRLVEAAPDLAWVCGVAEAWAVPFFQRGAIGFTSGVANLVPDRSLAVFDALGAGDVARAIDQVERLRPIEDLRARHDGANNVAVIKGAMDLVGLSGGPLRPPLAGLSMADLAELTGILRGLGLVP